jgi:hypothetical protein
MLPAVLPVARSVSIAVEVELDGYIATDSGRIHRLAG